MHCATLAQTTTSNPCCASTYLITIPLSFCFVYFGYQWCGSPLFRKLPIGIGPGAHLD